MAVRSSNFINVQQLSDDWINFITRQKQLKTLRITQGTVNAVQFKIVGAMPHLNDIRLTCDPSVSDKTIIIILQNTINLKKFFLMNTNQIALNTFRNKMNNTWNIIPYVYRGKTDVYFIRK